MEDKNSLNELFFFDEGAKNGKIRSLFGRFFSRLDFGSEERFFSFLRSLTFILLVFIEILILMQVAGELIASRNYGGLFAVFCLELVLTVTEGIKIFVFNEFNHKIALYIIDFLAAFLLIVTTLSTYLCVLYILLLTEFYISSRKLVPSWIVFVVSVPVYIFAYGWVLVLQTKEELGVLQLITQSMSALIALTLHFLFLIIVFGVYYQHIRLTKAKQELEKRNAALKKAYEELAVLAALEERQRIAKDIHDTAGHAVTTVIMQTEAAKLIIDSDVIEAKKKIVAANLQAKHALEELRDSVHILSGSANRETLKSAIIRILNESSNGTGIVIRSDVDEVVDVDEKIYRFVCNSLKEGISNGMRHGQATAFWFELKEREGVLTFLLSDNGAGANVAELQNGLGLSGLYQNAEKLGGTVELSSELGEGFEIRITLPCKEKGGKD
ncbi:MAG: hypothetical protein IJV80_04330 [Clostridia bacterium]|nr:hypothetical protein [Clostridia bacterium]